LVYQRLNRRKDAEAAYRKASMLSPNASEPYNALGTLKASEGKRPEAEQLYRQALQKNASLLPARHNLALLLDEQKDRQQEAIELFRENLGLDSGYIPSRLSLAEVLATRGDNAAAIQEYRAVLQTKPDYLAARIALAELLAKAGNRDQALAELHAASGQDSQNPVIFERIGDPEGASQHPEQARAAYQSALGAGVDRAARKRIGQKIKSLQ
jgi:tetratricopeptide (TPR) repeat protein